MWQVSEVLVDSNFTTYHTDAVGGTAEVTFALNTTITNMPSTSTIRRGYYISGQFEMDALTTFTIRFGQDTPMANDSRMIRGSWLRVTDIGA